MDNDFDVPANWHETFFTPAVNAFWEKMVPAEATAADLAFVRRHLGAAPPAHILDAPCGAGRHSLGLAAQGYWVTGLDISDDAIARASVAARDRGLAATFVGGDMRRFATDERFDAVISLGNSISYFEPEETETFFRRLAANLREGGRLILDSHCCAESIFPLQEGRLVEFEGGSYSARMHYDPMRSRLATAAELRLGGEVHQLRYAHFILTAGALVGLLESAGFENIEMYGDTKSSAFRPGSPRLLLVATRIA